MKWLATAVTVGFTLSSWLAWADDNDILSALADGGNKHKCTAQVGNQTTELKPFVNLVSELYFGWLYVIEADDSTYTMAPLSADSIRSMQSRGATPAQIRAAFLIVLVNIGHDKTQEVIRIGNSDHNAMKDPIYSNDPAGSNPVVIHPDAPEQVSTDVPALRRDNTIGTAKMQVKCMTIPKGD